MNIFFLRALLHRQMMPTPKFEQLMEQMRLDAERYRKVEQSDKLKQFLELDKQVSTREFQENKKVLTTKKYKDSDEAKKLARFKKLEKDKYVRLFLKKGEGEGRSSVRQYIELKAEIESPEFKKLNEFWSDPKRFEQTPEGKIDAQYQALLADEDIQFFRSMDVKEVEKCEAYKLVYEDDFHWARMETSDWKAGFLYPKKELKAVHSFTCEHQAYANGNNVSTDDSILYLKTEKEPMQAAAWDEKKGMVMHDFAYTSDVIHNKAVEIEEGSLVQVKVRCTGDANQSIVLRSEKGGLPFISVFNLANGSVTCSAKESEKSGLTRKALAGGKPRNFYVYTLYWAKDELMWAVNNNQVYHTRHALNKGEKLYLHMYSAQPKNKRAKTGTLEVDWIRVYKEK